jgi:hypothetical protein
MNLAVWEATSSVSLDLSLAIEPSGSFREMEGERYKGNGTLIK